MTTDEALLKLADLTERLTIVVEKLTLVVGNQQSRIRDLESKGRPDK